MTGPIRPETSNPSLMGDHNVTSTLAQPLSPEQLSQAAADAKRIRGQKATSFMLLRAAAPF
eukprot:CAMPEP_0180192134 /NCGR_PEP_ID=MMETSP0987-20121128/1824_1 /TAXON_ID=697907 /ORGANISM="non described non described, Strain CCMP2293" /LENGTH=60 /DNA_ID=CAMNT_0022146753 /DNA_START=411 /DNA_END=594 /DNA_ORIENTATION=+